MPPILPEGVMPVNDYGLQLVDHHAQLLADSAVSVDVARERGYRTAQSRKELGSRGFSTGQQRVPGLLIPVYDETGAVALHQYRPDEPRVTKAGKPVKYETTPKARMTVDVPPRVRGRLGDPSRPLWLTEGIRKADSAVTAEIDCLALLGVWNWRARNDHDGLTALAFWESVALKDRRVYIAFDSDVMLKTNVHAALVRLGAFLARRGAHVAYAYLPSTDGAKVGLDDYLAAGGTITELVHSARAEPREPDPEPAPATDPTPAAPPRAQQQQPVALTDALEVFRRWLYLEDLASVYITAATIVANLAPGDPVWLLIVAPPSGGKTEVLQSVSPLDYVHPVATVTEAALLSGTSKRDRGKDATGGVLRRISEFGVVLCKDFTSVLSQNKDTARAALAALREVYDGSWDRAVGTDGGRVLSWRGKCGLIGGVTPSLDRYSAVISALGDRFVLLRLPDVDPAEMGMRALSHAEHETEMRTELTTAMTGLINGADRDRVNRTLTDDEQQRLVALATYVARARTAVERDGYTGEVLVIPQPEGTGRIVLQLRRLYGALDALGVDEPTRWELLARLARDCVPAVRTVLMGALLANTRPLRTTEIATSVDMVTKTAHRHLEDLALLRVAQRSKVSDASNAPDTWTATQWLRDYFPSRSGTDKDDDARSGIKEGEGDSNDAHDGSTSSQAHLRTFLSRDEQPGANPNGPPRCVDCPPGTVPASMLTGDDGALRCRHHHFARREAAS